MIAELTEPRTWTGKGFQYMDARKGFQVVAKLGTSAIALFQISLVADAHPGPGPHDPVDGTVHLLTSPDHLAELFAFGVCGAVVALIAAVVLVRRRRG
jgi:hydrogenase/urease accessory protein HupE